MLTTEFWESTLVISLLTSPPLSGSNPERPDTSKILSEIILVTTPLVWSLVGVMTWIESPMFNPWGSVDSIWYSEIILGFCPSWFWFKIFAVSISNLEVSFEMRESDITLFFEYPSDWFLITSPFL